jgi:hypothetical protein
LHHNDERARNFRIPDQSQKDFFQDNFIFSSEVFLKFKFGFSNFAQLFISTFETWLPSVRSSVTVKMS